MQVKKQQLELNMEHKTGSKVGKEYVKAVYCHPDYLTYMQRTSCKMPGWMNHKLESRLLGETATTSEAEDTTRMAESKEELKSLLMRVKEESFQAGLKCNTQKTWQIDEEKMETVADFIFLGSKITVDSDCSHEL